MYNLSRHKARESLSHERERYVMEIPESVTDLIFKVVDVYPQCKYVAVFTDGFGGWDMLFCTTKEKAESLTAGQVNTEVVEVTD
jgi:hypothetical protein